MQPHSQVHQMSCVTCTRLTGPAGRKLHSRGGSAKLQVAAATPACHTAQWCHQAAVMGEVIALQTPCSTAEGIKQTEGTAGALSGLSIALS